MTRAADSLAGGDPLLSADIKESAVAGKVFFTNGGQPFVCSATAVNSGSKQLVVTAGHCVHQGKGGDWMKDWAFVPRYRDGQRPFGTYTAKEFRTFDEWIQNSNLQRDVGMVTTNLSEGRKIVDAVGGDGLKFNQPRSVHVTILAYPVDRDRGERQQACAGMTTAGWGATNRIYCNLTGGASGSGWVMDFNNDTGMGFVNGALSTVYKDGANEASRFDSAVEQMYKDQGDRT